MSQEVKLLRFWTSPFCGRIELALELKGVSYDCMDEDLPNKSALLLESSPIYKEVPVLLHKGRPIIGSMTILEYIDDAWSGHPLLPKDPYDRAQARFLAKFIDEKCIPTFRNSFWSEGEMQKNCLQQSREYLSILERELKGKKFFGGGAIGLLDIAASYIAHWVGVFQEVAEVNLQEKNWSPSSNLGKQP